MIIITSVELPESVKTKATFLLTVDLLELPNESVIYCGAIACGQDAAF